MDHVGEHGGRVAIRRRVAGIVVRRAADRLTGNVGCIDATDKRACGARAVVIVILIRPVQILVVSESLFRNPVSSGGLDGGDSLGNLRIVFFRSVGGLGGG